MKRATSIITAVYVFALVSFIGYGYFLQENSPQDLIHATVESPEIRISAKVAGRVESISVQEGDFVNEGDLIFTLENPEIIAKRDQALALIEAKTALKERAVRGARQEELAMAKDNMLQAQTASELAQKSLTRLTNLFNDGLVPEQKLDEAKAQANAANFALQAATQRFQMAENGTDQELISAAASDLRAAEGVLAEVDAALAETNISSHRVGEVASVLIHEGEISPAGFPVVTLIDINEAYLRFHVSEDQLLTFSKGQEFVAYLPALDKEQLFTVHYVAAMGDYANWKATKPGEYDLRTFEIRAKPTERIADWRVGMSAVIVQSESPS